MNSQIAERFRLNIVRVRHLVAIYDERSGSGRGRRTVKASDVLRAAVVMLHASVEDVLRSLERRVLPRSASDILSGIALVGLGSSQKFPLGELAQHRGKTVDALIDESVAAHLERATYNNAGELKAVLKRLGADASALENDIQAVARMMKRRHQIVHRADRDESAGSGHHQAHALSQLQVNEWIDAVESFVSKIFSAVPDIEGNAP